MNIKMVLLTYLEGDEECVHRLLGGLGVGSFSRMAVEGHGPAASGGWYGAGAPYRSELILVFTDEAQARAILEGVRACTAVEDPKHPIRAFQLSVEEAVACGREPPADAAAAE